MCKALTINAIQGAVNNNNKRNIEYKIIKILKT